MAYYARRTCIICGSEVSTNGLALTAHNRKHVRDGYMIERVYTTNNPRSAKGTTTSRYFEVTEAGSREAYRVAHPDNLPTDGKQTDGKQTDGKREE